MSRAIFTHTSRGVCSMFILGAAATLGLSTSAYAGSGGDLSLEVADCTNDDHPDPGFQIQVDVWMRNVSLPGATGFAAFVEYDDALLTYRGDLSSYAATFPVNIQPIGTADTAPGADPGELRIDGSADFIGPVPVDGDALLATLVFDVATDDCSTTTLAFDLDEGFDSELSFAGLPIPTTLTDTPEVLLDNTAPVITCGPNLVLNADAGTCLTGTLDFNVTFDDSLTLEDTQTPGAWYVDRYAPAVFESAEFMGDQRLCHGVDVADNNLGRPGGFSSAFYDTQGRKYDVDMPIGSTIGIDLWVPAIAETNIRRAGMWATTYDLSDQISGFPILGFSSANEAEDALGTPRFRAFVQDTDLDANNGITPGWIDLHTLAPSDLDKWYRFEITLTAAAYEFRIYDVATDVEIASLTDPTTFGSVRFGDYILQVKNFPDPISETYTMYWDNIELGPAGPVVEDACDAGGTLTFERSDNPALGLSDPFPSGTTTITWTATDACGNVSTCNSDVTVNSFNEVNVEVELVGVTIPSTRCITFNTDDCNSVTDVTLDFVDHDLNPATPVRFVGVIEVPCGNWTTLCAKDQQHTQWDTTTLTINGLDYVGDTLLSLAPGDTDDDGDVDINDVTLLIAQYGGAEPSGGCPWDGTRGADFSNNGQVFSEDYSLLSGNWLTTSECSCTSLLFADGRTSVSVHELHPWVAVRADLNVDGQIDADDVELFEAREGLPHMLSTKIRKSARLERSANSLR